MTSFRHDVKRRHKITYCSIALFTFFLAANVHAQSTPTELADMTLESLLDFDVTNHTLDEDKKRKRWEFAYTYRKLNSGGYRSGTTDFSFDDVLFSRGDTRTAFNFPVVPTYIRQNVHAFSGSYHINEKVSLNLALPYINQGTDHISSVPGFADFLLTSKGIGDIGLSGSFEKRLTDISVLHINLGLRIPTGSINVEGDTPRNGAGTDERLPYTMQLGSGTLDLTGAASYSRLVGNVKYGMNTGATLRTGTNSNNYRLGHNIGAAGWASYGKTHWFQPGVKLSLRHIDKIKGQDDGLIVPKPIPYPASITNPENFGGTKAHISALLKICPKPNCDVSISGEYGKPVYQDLNGIQPKDRSHWSLSASKKF